MNEKIENAKAALDYVNGVYKGKEDDLKQLNKKIYAMLSLSGVILLISILFLALALFTYGGKAIMAINIVGVLSVLSSIIILLVSLWDYKKFEYSDIIEKNLFENNDLIIFYREQISNLKSNFIVMDKIIAKKKSLILVSSICLFVFAAAVLAVLSIFVFTLLF